MCQAPAPGHLWARTVLPFPGKLLQQSADTDGCVAVSHRGPKGQRGGIFSQKTDGTHSRVLPARIPAKSLCLPGAATPVCASCVLCGRVTGAAGSDSRVPRNPPVKLRGGPPSSFAWRMAPLIFPWASEQPLTPAPTTVWGSTADSRKSTVAPPLPFRASSAVPGVWPQLPSGNWRIGKPASGLVWRSVS